MLLPIPSAPGNNVAPLRPITFSPRRIPGLALPAISKIQQYSFPSREIAFQWSTLGLLANVNRPCWAISLAHPLLHLAVAGERHQGLPAALADAGEHTQKLLLAASE